MNFQLKQQASAIFLRTGAYLSGTRPETNRCQWRHMSLKRVMVKSPVYVATRSRYFAGC
jgi:hypothetical protein